MRGYHGFIGVIFPEKPRTFQVVAFGWAWLLALTFILCASSGHRTQVRRMHWATDRDRNMTRAQWVWDFRTRLSCGVNCLQCQQYSGDWLEKWAVKLLLQIGSRLSHSLRRFLLLWALVFYFPFFCQRFPQVSILDLQVILETLSPHLPFSHPLPSLHLYLWITLKFLSP